jgi:hypothetical protein
VHDDARLFEYVPAEQLEQEVQRCPEYVPGKQSPQPQECSAEEEVPAGQSMQDFVV